MTAGEKHLFPIYYYLLMSMVVQQWFGLVAVGVGALFAYNAVKTYRIATRRHRFEPVTATVVESELEEIRKGTADSETRVPTTRYYPHITWEYTVGGKTYTNDKQYPGSDDKEKQQEIVDPYPEGETVEVQYDPADPSTSFLESVPEEGGAKTQGVIGGILLLIGLVLLVFTPI